MKIEATRRIKYKVIKNRLSCFAKGKFCLRYIQGKTVTAPPHTFGIMVFDTHTQAQDFTNRPLYSHDLKIIRVEPIGRGRRVKQISADMGGCDIDNFYLARSKGEKEIINNEAKVYSRSPPEGTICYKSVKVLE